MKVLDLFSGIGGFGLAAENVGFQTVAFCEIEPFPQTVLKYRFPNIPIFEDVRTLTKKSFYEKTGLQSVDIVCGGSPCQGFSVAGKQYGFDDNRSCLFSEQIRIARELSAKYIVWENVPGALSSNQGRDFKRVLTELTGHKEIECRKIGGQDTCVLQAKKIIPYVGGFSIRGFSESPKGGVESTLSQVLEKNVDQKYSLSAKACEGILRRAKRRGKILPPLLTEALEATINRTSQELSA